MKKAFVSLVVLAAVCLLAPGSSFALDACFTASNSSATCCDTFTFNASCSSGSISTLHWDWGDGSYTVTGSKYTPVNHSFGHCCGTDSVTLTVKYLVFYEDSQTNCVSAISTCPWGIPCNPYCIACDNGPTNCL